MFQLYELGHSESGIRDKQNLKAVIKTSGLQAQPGKALCLYEEGLWFGLNGEWNSGQGALGNKSWVIRVWDTGWHNELKTIKLNLTWMNFQFGMAGQRYCFSPSS